MKPIIRLLILLAIATNAKAQTNYEKQIREITTELSKKIGETDKKRIAVADFTDLDGTVTKLGRFIAEEFNTYLPEAGQGLEVIDRSRINVLIKENQMLRKGLTDPTAAAKLGQLAGVNALVFGTLTTFGESVRLNIKILDIQRGVVIRSMIGNVTRTADINKLLSELSSPDPEPDPRDPDYKQEPEPKPEQSKDKNCAKNHKGEILFYNTTKTDVLLSWSDPNISSMNVIVRAGNKHLAQGLYTENGSWSTNVSLYRDITKKGNAENYSIYVEECKTNPFLIK